MNICLDLRGNISHVMLVTTLKFITTQKQGDKGPGPLTITETVRSVLPASLSSSWSSVNAPQNTGAVKENDSEKQCP